MNTNRVMGPAEKLGLEEKRNELLAFLGGKSARNVPSIRSTQVVDCGLGGIGVKYHYTVVIEYTLLDGVVYAVLNTGDYRTVTTKKRLNDYLPRGFRIFSKDYQWYIQVADDSGNLWAEPAIPWPSGKRAMIAPGDVIRFI